MVNTQEWLESQEQYNTKEKRAKIYKLYLTEPELEGELDLVDFVGLQYIYISPDVNTIKLVIKNQGRYAYIIKLIQAQEWLEENYPSDGVCQREAGRDWDEGIINHEDYGKTRTQITELYISDKNLAGALNLNGWVNLEKLGCYNNWLTNLDLSSCSQLKELHCWRNQLTNLTLPHLPQLEKLNCQNNYLTSIDYSALNPEWLTELAISNNNLLSQDLTVFSQFINLKELYIGSGFLEKKINQDIYNRWVGSLRPLCNLRKLVKLEISNTDLNSGVEYLPTNLSGVDLGGFDEHGRKKIYYDTEESLKCQLIKIKWELDLFTSKTQKDWESLGFTLPEIKSWLEVGLTVKDYGLANYCQKEKNLTPAELVDKLEQLRKEFVHRQTEAKITNLIQHPEALEIIPYEQFTDIEYLAQGGFAKIYKAKWGKDRDGNDRMVALKSLNNFQTLTPEFLREIVSYKLYDSEDIIQCHGISHELTTGNYLMVMAYKKDGNLRQFSQINHINFESKLTQLYFITKGLNAIHTKGLIHKDFHAGNILNYYVPRNTLRCFIDLSLCRPANATDDGKVYGVLPYVAPEVLKNQPYTQASDIYSFGMVMYECLAGCPPYHDVAHDVFLSLEILKGLRPKFTIKIPQFLTGLINKCWDDNPLNRPTADELEEILYDFYDDTYHCNGDIYDQVQEAETFNKSLPTVIISHSSLQTHPQAIYHSRLLPTKNLTELLEKSQTTSEYHHASQIELNLYNLTLENNKVELEAKIEIPPKN